MELPGSPQVVQLHPRGYVLAEVMSAVTEEQLGNNGYESQRQQKQDDPIELQKTHSLGSATPGDTAEILINCLYARHSTSEKAHFRKRSCGLCMWVMESRFVWLATVNDRA